MRSIRGGGRIVPLRSADAFEARGWTPAFISINAYELFTMDDRRIQIAAGSVVVAAAHNDSPTSDFLWEALPIQGSAELWGDEVYFDIPVDASLDPEWAEETVDFGAVGFWPPGSALCLFFGPTPMSRGDEIRPASPVNVLGLIEGDPAILKRVRAGEPILIERI